MTAKKCILAVLVFVLTACIWTTDSSAAEKIDLKLRLKPGQKYAMRVITDQKISQTMHEHEQNINSLTDMGMGFEVLTVDADGTASVKITYQTIRAKMSGPMGLIEYESTETDAAVGAETTTAQMIRQMVAGMVGQSFVMKANTLGKVVEVKGFKEMMQQMAEKIGGDDPAENEEIKEFMKNFLSEDKVKMMGSNMTIAFPSRPVGIGDSWTDKETMSVGFPIEIDNTYTLKERKNGVAIVDTSSKMDLGKKGAPIDMGPMKMNMEMKGSYQGTSEINEASGWMIRSKMNMQLAGQVKIAPNEQMPEGMTVPMSIESVITIEPIEN